jgi:catechol 2,3-dioxygenase-like lactoylglutathione lyase family enzyme
MKIHRIDHVCINVNDLSAAKDFFLELGLEVQGETELEGDWLGPLIGLHNVKTALVFMKTADGETSIELVQYLRPVDENGIQQTFANTLGIRHIAFVVEDIEAIVAKLKKKGAEPFSEVFRYEDSYKLCYLRGPEGIIVELAEEIK